MVDCVPQARVAAYKAAGFVAADGAFQSGPQVLMIRRCGLGERPLATAASLVVLQTGEEPEATTEAEVAYALGRIAAQAAQPAGNFETANPYTQASWAGAVWQASIDAAMKQPSGEIVSREARAPHPGRGRAKTGPRSEWSSQELAFLHYCRRLPAAVVAAAVSNAFGSARNAQAVRNQRHRMAAAQREGEVQPNPESRRPVSHGDRRGAG